ncbi:hypothetical protein BJ508DRAFT_329664 [Ascobolus immersus RN42]|uniref:Uncharacterized protein n=1 Tax=Ascobolus immersus RN42 TaxID=1160509 RepID=A0A3N4HZX1_ASCIM|nr:hypothetical protein BJ508DRAFT_329664 [Ascobolus immersus RN42]
MSPTLQLLTASLSSGHHTQTAHESLAPNSHTTQSYDSHTHPSISDIPRPGLAPRNPSDSPSSLYPQTSGNGNPLVDILRIHACATETSTEYRGLSTLHGILLGHHRLTVRAGNSAHA